MLIVEPNEKGKRNISTIEESFNNLNRITLLGWSDDMPQDEMPQDDITAVFFSCDEQLKK